MPDPYQMQMMPYWNAGFQNPYGPQGTRDGMLLNQLSQGYAPVMTMPQQQLRTGFEQLPGFSNPGLTGMALNAFVAPMLQQQMMNQMQQRQQFPALTNLIGPVQASPKP